MAMRRSGVVRSLARFALVKEPPPTGEKLKVKNRDAKCIAVPGNQVPVQRMLSNLATIFCLDSQTIQIYDMQGTATETLHPEGSYFIVGNVDPHKEMGSGWAHTDPEQTSTVSLSQEFTGGGTVETDSMWNSVVTKEIERRVGRDRAEMDKLVSAFERFDLDNNMLLDLAELKNALDALNLRSDAGATAKLFLELDTEGKGHVDLAEFLDNIGGDFKERILSAIDENEARLLGGLAKAPDLDESVAPEDAPVHYHAEIMRSALNYQPGTYKPSPRKLDYCADQKEFPMDGNTAASYVAYALTETAFIYPISPATSMGELMDNWMSQGRKNCFGMRPTVEMMQSEAGAAGAVHGCLATGALSTTFTASQGLLLMIPNLFLIAGELSPCVIHVSARTVAKHGLSIFNDHSDVMACRQTGFAMLCGSTVQEVMDMATVAHISTIKGRVPFLNFFDGWRTSAGISKIKAIPYEAIRQLVPMDVLKKNLRDRALNPNHPIIRGVGQRPDIFFQNTQAGEQFYRALPGIVEETMMEVQQITGRRYKMMEYHGHPQADRCVVTMGSSAETVKETVDYLNAKGQKVGVCQIRLFRPWNAANLRATIPKSVRRIAVLDRTKEDGAHPPLYLDVVASYSEAHDPKHIVGGTYGLGSKEFTPGQAVSVFDNIAEVTPKNRFTIGINDDVCNTSLPWIEISTTPKETKQTIFWGLGGDGTIGANKAAIKTLTMEAGLYGQAYFNYDSHKENGATTSHLRFGPTPIKAEYMICTDADYIACHHPSYVRKYDMLTPIKKDGVFVLNCTYNTVEDLDNWMPPKIKRQIAQNNVQFYVINATKMALDIGLGHRINTIMQACFYKMSGVLPVDEALGYLKQSIVDLYTKKGPRVVKANQAAVDAALDNLIKVDYPASWAETPNISNKTPLGGPDEELFTHKNIPAPMHTQVDEFVKRIMNPVLSLEGDKLPVSQMTPGGYMPSGSCMHEKRGLAPEVPVWEPDKCTQCNYCAVVCPHAVIRPFLLDKAEVKGAPEGYLSRKAQGGAELAGLDFTIQLASMDCTGCACCVAACPDDALYMAPYEEVAEAQMPNWHYSINLAVKNPVGTATVKGSQFQTPLLEFSGACPGCGETPYVKMMTQLFGDRVVIANASGCSSVWGGTATTNPYTMNHEGRGPAWGRSLFEDNAEYGFGMALATKQRREQLQLQVRKALNQDEASESLKTAFANWLKTKDSYEKAMPHARQIERLLISEKDSSPLLMEIYREMDLLLPQSQWIIGGDGWAYDIGYNGVDHVLSKGENVNILVLDTEMYSNTGGQVSKSTQKSAVLKFAQKGKKELKKDLGRLAMQYENVYVASIALGANYNQSLQAFREAESYEGTSLIICYAPCIDWGINMKYMMDAQKTAVESGIWKLYRYDPRMAKDGLPPLQLDAQKIKMDKADSIFEDQNRFAQLRRKDQELAVIAHDALKTSLIGRHESYKRMSMDDTELLDYLKAQVGEQTGEKTLVLYASETGTAQGLAKEFGGELKRRGVRAKVSACDDYDFENLGNETSVILFAATCGQGDIPENAHEFMKELNAATDEKLFEGVKFAVFAMGDTGYAKFNKVGKDIDERMAALGGTRLIDCGLGDDKDDEKWETVFAEWEPELCGAMELPEPPAELGPPAFKVELGGDAAPETDVIVPAGAARLPMPGNVLKSPEGWERDIRHFEVNLEGTGVGYTCGDAMGVYPWNAESKVLDFLQWYGVEPDTPLKIDDHQGTDKFTVSQTTPKQLLVQYLDLFGRPSRKFYKKLAMVATDPDEKAKLEHLMTKEGKEDLMAMIGECVTHADVIRMFPSAKPSIEYLIEFIPPVKQRLYSIASSPAMDGECLHMCIVADDWKTPKGEYKHGLTTGYLAGRDGHGPSPTEILAKVNPSTFTLPASPKQPIILVGLGTGIAPCRALIRDRMAQKAAGDEIGPMMLYFGVRYKATEYTYGEEWDELHDNGNGPLTHLCNAFSRDQAHKIYCQHRIKENSELVADYLFNQNGYYLLCGPGGPPVKACRKELENSLVSHKGLSAEEAEEYVTQMQIEGRYNEEVW